MVVEKSELQSVILTDYNAHPDLLAQTFSDLQTEYVPRVTKLP